MWRVNPPQHTATEAARACAKGIRSGDLKQRVLNAVESFAANSESLQAAGRSDTTHMLVAPDYEVPGLSKNELNWLYKNRFSRANTPGRDIYDSILRAAPNGLCAYCQYSVANTLDHYAPKAFIHGLSIDPWNLIPACMSCNHTLSDGFSDQPESQLLHPYFAPDSGRWLYAMVAQGPPAALRFYARPDPGLPPIFRQRMTNQIAALGLLELYGVVAARDLTEISKSLPRLHEAGGAETVRAHLLEMSEDCFSTEDLNNRRAVVYEALAANEWYYRGGFAE